MSIKENATKGKITNYIAIGVMVIGGGFLVYKGQSSLTELGALITVVATLIGFGKK